ncbi:MAG: ABC transporter permease [Tannerellaceae bacterium]|nr:ABC transporter permease [Tannerellaceae bacterium]
MILLYFRHAWQLLKQNPFYSIIYILGTGLSISMIMVIAILFYIRTANIYPKTKRDRMLFARHTVANTERSRGTSHLSLETAKTCFSNLNTAEAVTIVYSNTQNIFAQPDYSKEQVPVEARYTDVDFWKVFDFKFIQGSPFTEADLQSGIRNIVVSESFAKKMTGTTEAVGKTVSLDFENYNICGVVKDVSYIMVRSFGTVWMPYSLVPETEQWWNREEFQGLLGPFDVYLVAPSVKDKKKVKQEAEEILSRFGNSLTDVKFTLNIDNQLETYFRESADYDINFTIILLQYILLIIVLLLIPAVSLTGLTDSFMDKRIAEIGIRRSFGASRYVLMKQLITENLVFTLLGGLMGLILSYLIMIATRQWIIHIGFNTQYSSSIPEGTDVLLSTGMLMNIPIFLAALLFCILFNLLAVGLPAWRTANREIVNSLNIR